MYMEISQLKELGFSKSKIAKKMGIARGTLNSYLEKNPNEMSVWLASTKRRTRKLDKYRKEILGWLKEHPDLSEIGRASCREREEKWKVEGCIEKKRDKQKSHDDSRMKRN